MLSYSVLLFALAQLLHLTLAVPNPTDGVPSPDPAATDDQFFKVKMTEPAMIPREAQAHAESTTTGAIVQRRDKDSICLLNKGQYSNAAEVEQARNEIYSKAGQLHQIEKGSCSNISTFKSGKINLCGHNSGVLHHLIFVKFEEVGYIVDGIMKNCTEDNKIGGTFINEARGFSVRLGQ